MPIAEIRYVYKETERQLIFEWRELEERLKKEEEQRLAEQEAERECHLSSAREKEEQRKCRIKKFEEDLKKMENTVVMSKVEPPLGAGGGLLGVVKGKCHICFFNLFIV